MGCPLCLGTYAKFKTVLGIRGFLLINIDVICVCACSESYLYDPVGDWIARPYKENLEMKQLTVTVLFALAASHASAGNWETRCETKSVPYQETIKGGKPGEVLGGAVIGGVLGKAVTGKDGGAVAGAIIGGAVVNESSKRTVTKYKEVETCTQVFVPEQIEDEALLRESIVRLNAGERLNKELVMDVQHTIGASPDGVWGPKSVEAANAYLMGDEPATQHATSNSAALYSLTVNDVVVVSSYDLTAIDEIKRGLSRAGVDSVILVDPK